MSRERALAAAYDAATRVTREKAKSFHFASFCLPAAKRRAVFAVYDFCRHADDLVDERGDRPVAAVRADLADMAAMLRALHQDPTPADERWLALHDAVRRFEVPIAPFLELLEGVAHDLEPRPMPDAPALLRYCHQVAGVVGLMLGPLLGARGHDYDTHGAALGTAMQLTNVLRDVAPDLAAGRLYLPATELAQFGLTADDLRAGMVTPAWVDFMRFQIARARDHYALGDAVVPLFPSDGSRLTVRLMQRTYAGILDAIERRGYDVFTGRAHVGPVGKLAILAKAAVPARGRPAAGTAAAP